MQTLPAVPSLSQRGVAVGSIPGVGDGPGVAVATLVAVGPGTRVPVGSIQTLPAVPFASQRGVAVGSLPGVGDGPGVAVATLVAVGLGRRVLVAVGRTVAVGVLVFVFGKDDGLPGNVNAMISWRLVKPSPSESNDSIAPSAAEFRPLSLYACP
jgi:hypothetical protein